MTQKASLKPIETNTDLIIINESADWAVLLRAARPEASPPIEKGLAQPGAKVAQLLEKVEYDRRTRLRLARIAAKWKPNL